MKCFQNVFRRRNLSITNDYSFQTEDDEFDELVRATKVLRPLAGVHALPEKLIWRIRCPVQQNLEILRYIEANPQSHEREFEFRRFEGCVYVYKGDPNDAIVEELVAPEFFHFYSESHIGDRETTFADIKRQFLLSFFNEQSLVEFLVRFKVIMVVYVRSRHRRTTGVIFEQPVALEREFRSVNDFLNQVQDAYDVSYFWCKFHYERRSLLRRSSLG
jgi:hypothetical protein